MRELEAQKASLAAANEKKLRARLDALVKVREGAVCMLTSPMRAQELEKAEKSSVSPSDLFRNEPNASTLYAAYDADGVPERLVVNTAAPAAALESATASDESADTPGDVSKSMKKKFAKQREYARV
jgi:hypothetical protein